MNTQTNTFRLPRLANTIQLRKKSASNFEPYPLQPVKLASFHAVNRSVKYNDLSFVTGRDLNKLRKQPEQSDNIEYESAHENLTSTRKKYDNLGKQRAEKDHEVTQLTQERNKFKSIEDEYLANKEKANKQVSNMQTKLNDIKYQLDQTQTEKKVLQNMISRIKTDKITYDQRKFNLEKELVYLKKQKQIIIQQSSGQSEEDDRTKKVYAKLIRQLEAQQKQREDHIRSLETMLEQKIAVQQKNQMRKKEMIEVAEQALQDKDTNEKNWEKIYLCHRFVEKLLRDKMNTEMNKFSTVEIAFKNIKTATGVADGQTLVSKFLNKEVVYGELLGKIAENEKKISSLKQQNEQMTKERKMLKDQRSLYYITKKEQADDEGLKEMKEFQNVNGKLVICQLFESKIKGWLVKNAKKFNAIDNKNENIAKTGFIEEFKGYLKLLSSAVDQLNAKDDISTNASELADPSIPNDRIFRVKPKVKKLNASKEEIENEFQEEQITNPYEDDDCLNTQRVELLRNNDKFMKQLKKKYEEIKKAKIEAAPKVKEEKPKVAPPPPAD